MSTKVGAATVGAALATLVAWGLAQFAHIDMPDDAKMALGVVFVGVITLAAGWFTPEQNPTESMVEAVRAGKGAAK